MSIYTVVIAFALVCTSLITYSTVFNLEYLTGSVYLNTIIYGLFRYIINITIGFSDFKIKSLGRKTINNAFLTVILLLIGSVAISKLLGTLKICKISRFDIFRNRYSKIGQIFYVIFGEYELFLFPY
jgi:hypothetical protein